MAVLYTNRAVSSLAAGITNSATTFSVASGEGALFPSISGGDHFYVTIDDNAGAVEIVKVTARSTDTFTVVRGQDGTSGLAFSAGAFVELRVVKAMLDDVKFDAVQNLTLLNMPSAAFKRSVRVATTANITLSGTQTIDGVTVAVGDRVLVKNQTTSSQNGIYVVSSTAWARAPDADTADEIGAAIVNVDTGTANGGESWTTTFRATDTLGVSSMPWYEVVFNNGTWAINITGSAASLTTSRTINGTSFNGTGNIITSYWGSSRTLTIGSTGKSVNGSANVSWSLSEIGALANVTPGTAGNVLTSNGSAWVSQAPAAGGQYLGSAATKAIAYNSNTIAENITITSGLNGLSAGPITINSGYTVTVQSGAVWAIV